MARYVFYAGYQKKDGAGGVKRCVFDSLQGIFEADDIRLDGFNPAYLTANHAGNLIAGAGTTEKGAAILLMPRDLTSELPQYGPASLYQVHAAGLSHISFSHDDRFILVTDYAQGLVQVYRIDDDQRAVVLVGEAKQEGSGPNLERQRSSHPHSVFQSTVTGMIAVSDLGADTLTLYRTDANGKLNRRSEWKCYPGTGPRHVEFHTNKKCGYLLTELSADIILFELDDRGNPIEKQCVHALQPGFDGYNLASEIRLSFDGRFLYASNRGGNSIGRFVVAEDGTLSDAVYVPTRGWPREFLFTEDGRYLLVLNEEFANSRGELEAFHVDVQTGLLTNMGLYSSLPGAYTMALAGREP